MRTWVALARQALDHAARAYEPKPTCRGRGCVGCCTGPIPVHPHELEDVLPRVTDEQRAAARAIVAAGDPLTDYWCPLLDRATGTCTVYVQRPLICRGHASITPPENCWPGSRKAPKRHPMQLAALADAVKASGLRVTDYHVDNPLLLVDAIATMPDPSPPGDPR